MKVALVLALALFVHSANAQMTPASRAFIVSEHNRIKRSISNAADMIEYEYDMKLECVAQAYIETQSGGFSHNSARSTDYASCGGSGYVGENWYSSCPDSGTGCFGDGATHAWCDYKWSGCSERENYFQTGSCGAGVTGHFTQVAWAKSYKVGCGYTSAGGTVCNYSPGGNYGGQAPWVSGAACTQCPSTHPHCNNGLCSIAPGKTAATATGSTGSSSTTLPHFAISIFLIVFAASCGAFSF